MARRLDDDDRSVADLFGVEVDGGKYGAARARAKRIEEEENTTVPMSERDWEKYERDYDKNRVASVAKARRKRLESASLLGGGRVSDETGKTVAMVGTGALALYVLYKLTGVLRAAASEGSKRLAYVPRGTAVSVLESAAGAGGQTWYRVHAPQGDGWMHGGILA